MTRQAHPIIDIVDKTARQLSQSTIDSLFYFEN